MAQRFLDREGWVLLLIGLSVGVLLVGAGYFLWRPPAEPGEGGIQPAATTASPSDTGGAATQPRVHDTTLEFQYPGEDGRTVLELLNRNHEIVLDSELLLFGSIVLAIDSFTAAPDEYWIFYRDSLRGDRSPEVCTTHHGETIRWVLKRRR